MNDMQALTPIAETIRADLSAKNEVRDKAISQSRELIRYCAECIRAVHRREWANVDQKLGIINQTAAQFRNETQRYPELYYSGYTQDALKEYVEAHLTSAIIRGQPLPTPAQLNVEAATYLNGMSEAATELRRYILDIMRLEQQHSDEAERLLAWMDAIYDQLVTFDFPDALTGGLRRQTDILRGVLERTRGDMTLSLRQERLHTALLRFEERFGEQVPLISAGQLRQVLSELSQTLQQTTAATPAQQAELTALQDDVQQALTTPTPTPTLRQRLQDSLLHFEVGHPELITRIEAALHALTHAGI
jgi:translin